jgi:hypothetical protein
VFDTPFAGIPQVVTAPISSQTSYYIAYETWIDAVTDKGFTLRSVSTELHRVNWIATCPRRLDYPGPLTSATWAQIAEFAAHANLSEYYNIGDEKDIVLSTGETLTLQIYGFAHDDAAVTFGLKNLMADTHVMNSSNANSGGFTGSQMYTWLRGDLYNSLPEDLKAAIKPVSKRTSAGGQSSTVAAIGMKVFLFSEVECFGTYANSVNGEGTQYPIFTNSANRVKRLANGAGAITGWWERSPVGISSNNFCNVTVGGGAGSTVAGASYGVNFGFCV